MSNRTITTDEFRKLTDKPAKKPRKRKADHLARFLATPPAPEQTPVETAKQRSLFDRHDNAVVSLRLPFPPSVNHYWRAFVRPGARYATPLISSEGRAYKEAVKAAWRAHWKGWPPEPLTGRLRLLVTVVFPTRACCDLDNRVKPLQDAMKEAGVYGDDSQIDHLGVLRGAVTKPGWVDVVIETISE